MTELLANKIMGTEFGRWIAWNVYGASMLLALAGDLVLRKLEKKRR